MKKCFIISPIGKPGTDTYQHFQALFNNLLQPTVASFGYDVTRSDEVTKAGAITKEIVTRLGQADLVIADLTNLNPNVFYELGVRHALRGRGTLMILDSLSQEKIPFDLSAYRVINFESNLQGIGKLQDELRKYIETFETDLIGQDNPVHDWLPALPSDVLASADKSADKVFRIRIKELEGQIQQYVSRYGKLEQLDETGLDALEVIEDAIQEVSTGHSPFEIIEAATNAAQQRNLNDFLSIVKRALQSSIIQLSDRQYIQLGSLSDQLGLDKVTTVIYEQATKVHIGSDALDKALTQHNAHSSNPANRARARQKLMKDLGIEVSDDGSIDLLYELSTSTHFATLGVMLDTFHRDGLHEQALAITTAMVKKHRDISRVMRNHARALENIENIGNSDLALQCFREAILCHDVDDNSAAWYGNSLHNIERHVDAVEAYLLGGLLDPADATYYSHVFDELTIIWREKTIGRNQDSRQLPSSIEPDLQTVIEKAALAAVSCESLSQNDINRCITASGRIDSVDFGEILRLRISGIEANNNELQLLSMQERISWLKEIYDHLKSDITIRAENEPVPDII